MRYITILILTMALLFTLFSCKRKDLLEPHIHLNVKIKADINANVTLPSAPRTINYIFESKDNGNEIAGRIIGNNHEISIKPGKYKALFYTSDFNELDAIIYRGFSDLSTAEAYTLQNSRSIDQYYINEPDPLFSKFSPDIEILQLKETDIMQEIKVILEQRSFLYYMTIGVDGIEHLRSARLEISGMSTSVFLADGKNRDDEVGIQSVDMLLKENAIYCEFWAFGPHQDKDIKHRVFLYFTNGKNTVIELDDISDNVKPLTAGGEIKVEQKFIIHPGDGSAGFDPGIDDWDDIVITIPI